MSDRASGSHDGRLSLLVKAARMYHEEGLLQPEIAHRLGISQSGVSRALKEAQRRGIVRTVVVPPVGLHTALESELRIALGLRDAIVAESASEDDAVVVPAIGAALAAYLAVSLKTGERIGISSRSASLLAVVEALSPMPGRAELVVQTLGSVGTTTMRAQSTRLVDRLAQLTGAEPVYLPAPGVVTSRLVREGLLSDPALGDAVDAWGRLSVLLTGIGSARPSPLRVSWGSALPEEDLARLESLDAVGDVCLNFFAADGSPVDGGLRDRVIGIGADELRSVPRRIGVAGGAHKDDAIRAAARGGWIDVLATDQHTARRLLR